MRHRGILVCLALAAVGFGAAVCFAQETTTQPAPKLQPVKTDKADTPPAGGAVSPAPAGQPTTGPATRPAGTTKRPPSSFFEQYGLMIVMLGGIVLLFYWTSRSRKKQEAKRKEMLAGLSKGDKVVTVGGIMGTVIEARPEELTVKVDETNNVRMKFARWAVRGVGDQAKQEQQDKN